MKKKKKKAKVKKLPNVRYTITIKSAVKGDKPRGIEVTTDIDITGIYAKLDNRPSSVAGLLYLSDEVLEPVADFLTKDVIKRLEGK